MRTWVAVAARRVREAAVASTSTQIVGGGYWSLGDRGYSPFQGGTNIFTINDTFDMIRGKHDIRIGGGIRINEMNVRAEGFQDGFWVIGGAWTSDNFSFPGNSMADVLLGLASVRIHDQNFNGDITGRRWKLFRPFVQDDWRITRSLTLNLGLAWALATPISEAAGRIADFLPTPTSYQLLIPGPGCSAAVQPCTNVGAGAGVGMDRTAFEPRFGFAWKVFGSDKTVLRGGYAIYHDSAWSMGAQGLWQNPPFAGESFGISFGGCTTATAYCAIATRSNAQHWNRAGGRVFRWISDSHPASNAGKFFRGFHYRTHRSKTGNGPAVQRQRGAATARAYRADRRAMPVLAARTFSVSGTTSI